MSLPNLATLISNLQSEFTHHVTLFCKVEFKFYSKMHLINPIRTLSVHLLKKNFSSYCKFGFFFVDVRLEFSSFGFSCNLVTLTIAFQEPTLVRHHG